MSALPPKADMVQHGPDARFAPKDTSDQFVAAETEKWARMIKFAGIKQ
jgi:hypothetical protein